MRPNEELGVLEPYATLEAAEEAARAIVEHLLQRLRDRGLTAPELVELWHGIALDLYIDTPAGEPPSSFSSRDYVRQLAPAICPSEPRLI